MVNSTITHNRADRDGGGVEASTGSEVSLNSVTVARNTADADGNSSGIGGGLHIGIGGASFSVVNSIVALNEANGLSSDCYGGTFSSGGGNLIGSAQGCVVSGGSDIVRREPEARPAREQRRADEDACPEEG